MIGKILGAIAGERAAKRMGGAGPLGAVAGVAAASAMRRMGVTGLAAAAVGGLALKYFIDRKRESQAAF